MARRSGRLVLTRQGKTGIVFHDEPARKVQGVIKLVVHVVGEDFNPTGEKVLCNAHGLRYIGMVD